MCAGTSGRVLKAREPARVAFSTVNHHGVYFAPTPIGTAEIGTVGREPPQTTPNLLTAGPKLVRSFRLQCLEIHTTWIFATHGGVEGEGWVSRSNPDAGTDVGTWVPTWEERMDWESIGAPRAVARIAKMIAMV